MVIHVFLYIRYEYLLFTCSGHKLGLRSFLILVNLFFGTQILDKICLSKTRINLDEYNRVMGSGRICQVPN